VVGTKVYNRGDRLPDRIPEKYTDLQYQYESRHWYESSYDSQAQEVPLEALARIEAFLHMDISSTIIFAYLASGSTIGEQKYEALVAITKVLDMLYQLRREILRNISQINSRYHHVEITHRYEQVKTGLSEYLDKVYTEMVEGIMRGAEAYEEGTDTDEKVLPVTGNEEETG
jgi:hypothetical protein